jgi:pimeloyl-ACP methyl ester carboxylesterase
VPLARPPLRRAIGAVTAILVFILLLGATYQGVATALERREFARPGGMVSVGDHQLHIYCTGRGTPSVVLEAPAAGLSAAWADVQRQLSAVTRVCSYDRAGLGWSESGDRPFDPDAVPGELRTLLTRANVPGPFVVVGHGLGAAFARMYAARPDADAVALVLVDPPAGSTGIQPGWIMPASPWLARTGVLRAGRILSSRADGLAGGGALQAFLNRPDHLARAADELLAWNDLVQQTAGLQPASSRTRVMTVDLRTGDRIAFLTNPAAVDRVVAAIRAAMTSPRG